MAAPRINVDSRQLGRLLAGEAVTLTHRGSRLPQHGEGVPVVLSEPMELRVVVTKARLIPTRRRRQEGTRRHVEKWILTIKPEDAPPPTLLAAESGVGAAVTPLGTTHDPDSPEAHGYTDKPGEALDAGEAVPSAEIPTFAASQESAERFAAEKVDVLAKRRAKSLGARTRDALMQARAHGVDASEAIDALEETLRRLELAARRKAA